MMRYTRTQHRRASRQVNDHGRVSGTHRFRAPSWDQESVRDSVHEDSASARIAAGQRPRPSFRHPQALPRPRPGGAKEEPRSLVDTAESWRRAVPPRSTGCTPTSHNCTAATTSVPGAPPLAPPWTARPGCCAATNAHEPPLLAAESATSAASDANSPTSPNTAAIAQIPGPQQKDAPATSDVSTAGRPTRSHQRPRTPHFRPHLDTPPTRPHNRRSSPTLDIRADLSLRVAESSSH